MNNQLVPLTTSHVPGIAATAGDHALTHFWEFFVSNTYNPTRAAPIAEWCR